MVGTRDRLCTSTGVFVALTGVIPRKWNIPKSRGEKYLGDSEGKSTRGYELLESKWESTIGVRYSWIIDRHGATSGE